MAKVLVTGGSGFIGSHLVAALVARGDFVRIFDRVAPGQPADGVEFVQGSILDRALLSRALDGIDRVFHLAGIAHLWTARRGEFDHVNRIGTETLLSAIASTDIARFVHCSTEAILLPPNGGGHPIDETVSLAPADMPGPYTRSKYFAEQKALSAARSGAPVIVVNPTLPVGPGDHRLTPPTAMLARCLGSRMPVSLDFALNLADVRDIAQGMILAADHGRIGERYILGGDNMSMRELAAVLEGLTGKRPVSLWISPWLALTAGVADEWLATNITGKMPAATAEGVRLALRSRPLDIGKARRELGYAPRPIADALARALTWLAGMRRKRGAEPIGDSVVS
ncbi:MAG: NAD-dependent epimerase/dehydratase family protein [Pseudomonadota bacterium]|nr:NAD-dependent epimerase/dehydratase family protein [Pseudomonadota bacterium]